jgi:hypothetical protein
VLRGDIENENSGHVGGKQRSVAVADNLGRITLVDGNDQVWCFEGTPETRWNTGGSRQIREMKD